MIYHKQNNWCMEENGCADFGVASYTFLIA
jgi:hypothetical protein